ERHRVAGAQAQHFGPQAGGAALAVTVDPELIAQHVVLGHQPEAAARDGYEHRGIPWIVGVGTIGRRPAPHPHLARAWLHGVPDTQPDRGGRGVANRVAYLDVRRVHDELTVPRALAAAHASRHLNARSGPCHVHRPLVRVRIEPRR